MCFPPKFAALMGPHYQSFARPLLDRRVLVKFRDIAGARNHVAINAIHGQ